MTDYSDQELLQQLHAAPKSGEELELLGKHAACHWLRGEASTLSAAVVGTVKHAGLSPEQVRRVIEFANTEAYLQEFKKEGQSHRVVDFVGGPANPAEVFQDLNDGGGGTVFDDGLFDYGQAPTKKEASSDEAFLAMFGPSTQAEYPSENPLQEADDLRVKLAAAEEHLTAEIDGLERVIDDTAENFYQHVKQAALHGNSLGEVVQALHQSGAPVDKVKIAFAYLSDRLTKEGVFETPEELTRSITKTGSARQVNKAHPMLQDFFEFCGAMDKVAELREARREISAGRADMTTFLSKAAAAPVKPGALRSIQNAFDVGAEHVGKAVGGATHWATGSPSAASTAAGIASFGVKALPTATAAVGAHEAYRHLKYSPTVNKVVSMTIPGSDAYNRREMELAARSGMYQGY